MNFNNQRILITGGTGSLGKMVLRTMLSGKHGTPKRIRILSRDESKHYDLKKELGPTPCLIDFMIGDVRCYSSVASALMGVDIVVNAAALKHVPACEVDPIEAVRTNVMGIHNIVRVIREHSLDVETVLGISTDKACSPISVMGMTKALQERILIQANNHSSTRFIAIRYGNILESRGSVVPLFREQIAKGGPVTVTHPEMVRFFISLRTAALHLVNALQVTNPGQIYVPQMRAALVRDLAEVMIAGSRVEIKYTGIRPGEKLEDTIISEAESIYTSREVGYFLMDSPSLGPTCMHMSFTYSSGDPTLRMSKKDIKNLLESGNEEHLPSTLH
jgi:FlaA1/EpsC-like NDP-sugar epimerase